MNRFAQPDLRAERRRSSETGAQSRGGQRPLAFAESDWSNITMQMSESQLGMSTPTSSPVRDRHDARGSHPSRQHSVTDACMAVDIGLDGRPGRCRCAPFCPCCGQCEDEPTASRSHVAALRDRKLHMQHQRRPRKRKSRNAKPWLRECVPPLTAPPSS